LIRELCHFFLSNNVLLASFIKKQIDILLDIQNKIIKSLYKKPIIKLLRNSKKIR
ncbi:MAG: hypothetical protein ACI976_002886, partial [Aureispira sp.]